MYKDIKELADSRLTKIHDQLHVLSLIDEFPKLIYTDFKDSMGEPHSHIVNLVNSREDRLTNHDIQKWFMKCANTYLQTWLHEKHPEYESKITVSDRDYSTFPSRFRIMCQVSPYKDFIHTGQMGICRFDVYEKRI